eukprot:RCo043602
MRNPRAFLTFSQDGRLLGTLTFELFADTVPRTVENFRKLCTGEQLSASGPSQRLWYKGSRIFRVVPNSFIQGGDFHRNTGGGGESIYGRFFDDESFANKHSSVGTLTMANMGPNTNSSQFVVTAGIDPAELDGRHVAFGRLVDGLEVLLAIQAVECDRGNRPVRPVLVTRCGVVGVELPKKVLSARPRRRQRGSAAPPARVTGQKRTRETSEERD